jgi:hypothetical protein
MIFLWFKQYFLVVQLHLESFHSDNLAHFHLEQNKSNQNGTIHEQNEEKQTRTEQYFQNGMGQNFNLAHAWWQI